MSIDEMIEYWTKKEEEYVKNPPQNISSIDRMIPLQWIYKLTMIRIEQLINNEDNNRH